LIDGTFTELNDPGAAAAPGSSASELLRIVGLEKRFGSGPLVLGGVDVAVRPGELLVVLGANGSGKSTLLRCAVRLLQPDAGQVWLCGQDLATLNGKQLRDARRQAAMIFQQIQLVRRRTALENVAFGALGRLSTRKSLAPRLFPKELRNEAARSLERVGLAHKANDRADRLSGGQAQRVAVARALCQRAAVVLADEPVASLDPQASDAVLTLLRDIAHVERLGVVCVLHQPDLARRYADRLVGILNGLIVFDRRPGDVEGAEIDRLYVGEPDDE